MAGGLDVANRQNLTQALMGRPGIVFAILYGSAANEDQFRDLDIGIFVDRQQVPASSDWEYAFELAAALESQVPYPVDVRVLNDTPLAFKYNVTKGTPLLVNDAETWSDFKEWTWILYLDFQPVAMRYLEEML